MVFLPSNLCFPPHLECFYQAFKRFHGDLLWIDFLGLFIEKFGGIGFEAKDQIGASWSDFLIFLTKGK